MTPEQFSDLLLIADYEKVQEALDHGFDPNTIIDGDKTPLESTSFSDDYKMMEILWKAGAKPTTPWTEEIVKQFENGKTWEALPDKEVDSQDNLEDLTASFSVKRFKFDEGEIIKDGNEHSINLPISPFILDNQMITTSVEMQGIAIDLPLENLVGKTITFPVNPEPGYIDGSMFIRSSHIPVDVVKLKIKKLNKEKVYIDIFAAFLFEHEPTGFKNEKLKIAAVVTLVQK